MKNLKMLALVPLMATLFLGAGAAAQTRMIGAATGVVTDSAGEKKWFRFRTNIEEQSAGAIEVQLLLYGEAGSEENIISAVRRNRVQVANLSAMIISTVVPAVAVVNLPYLFDSADEADFIMDEHLSEPIAELLLDQGLVFLSWEEIGFHQVYGGEPLLVPSDAENVRFRVASSMTARMFAHAIGADVIPLPFADNVMGLQTGLVTAGENAVVMYARTGISEYARHLTLTDHSYAVNLVVASQRAWSRMDESERRIIGGAWVPPAESRRLTRAEVTEDLGRAVDLGFTIHGLSQAQRASWRNATSGVADEFLDSLGPDARRIYEIVQEGKAAFAEAKER